MRERGFQVWGSMLSRLILPLSSSPLLLLPLIVFTPASICQDLAAFILGPELMTEAAPAVSQPDRQVFSQSGINNDHDTIINVF